MLLNANIKADARISTPMDTEALSILNQIEGALEDEAKARLPEVPTSIPLKSERKHQLKRLSYWLKARLVDQTVD